MIRLRRVALTLVVFSAATTLGACSREPEFALVIRGGSVMDGAGGEAQPADVGIKGDRIVAIGNLSGRSASAAIDATGKIVSPGFIDVKSRLTPVSGLADSHLRQGITTRDRRRGQGRVRRARCTRHGDQRRRARTSVVAVDRCSDARRCVRRRRRRHRQSGGAQRRCLRRQPVRRHSDGPCRERRRCDGCRTSANWARGRDTS